MSIQNYTLTVEILIDEEDGVYPEDFMVKLAKDLENGKTVGEYKKENSSATWMIVP